MVCRITSATIIAAGETADLRAEHTVFGVNSHPLFLPVYIIPQVEKSSRAFRCILSIIYFSTVNFVHLTQSLRILPFQQRFHPRILTLFRRQTCQILSRIVQNPPNIPLGKKVFSFCLYKLFYL